MPATPRTTPNRLAERVRHDRDLVHRILDEALVSHLGFTVDEEPRVLPTLHVRNGDTLYLHGSTGSRPLLAARDSEGLPVCVAVTLLDGLVLARSQFHHSANYRSVVIHGRARLVADETRKRQVLTALVEHLVPGRSHDSRPPTDKELAQTAVLAVPLDEATAKVRAGGPAEEPDDLLLKHWSGVLPVTLTAGAPEAGAEGLPVPLPPYLHGYCRHHAGQAAGRDRWYHPAVMTGDRVRLEPLDLRHADDLFQAGRDPEVWRWLSSGRPDDPGEMRRQVTEALQARRRDERVAWAVVERTTGRAIGTTSYHEIDPAHRSVAIGHTWLGRPWWRTGVNTEAKLLLLTRAFEDLQAVRVMWHTDARNDRSQRAIERLGASREGLLRHHRIRPDGTLRDTVQYAMTADDWPPVRDRLRARARRAVPAG